MVVDVTLLTDLSTLDGSGLLPSVGTSLVTSRAEAAVLLDAPQPISTIRIETNVQRALDAVYHDGFLWIVSTSFGTTLTRGYFHKVSVSYNAGTGSLSAALVDQGYISASDISVGTFTYSPSVAVNNQGLAVFGFSASSPTVFAGAYATFLKPSDPPGTGVGPSLEVKRGEDWYAQDFRSGRYRWGDYSGISVDPTDEN